MLITNDLGHLPSVTLVGGAQVNTYMHTQHTRHRIVCLKSNIAIAYMWMYNESFNGILQFFRIIALFCMMFLITKKKMVNV